MPNYSYRCTCGWTGDQWRHVDHRDNAKCPTCGQRMKRQFTPPMISIPMGFGVDAKEDFLPFPDDPEGQANWDKGVPVGRGRRGD